MKNMPKSLEINYNELRLNDPKSFIEYAKKLTENFSEEGAAVSNIKCLLGQRFQNNPKIFFNQNTDFYEIKIPEKRDDQNKLAALLYAFAYGNNKDCTVLYVSKDQKTDITSKHKMHAGVLQKKIEKFCEGKEMEIETIEKEDIRNKKRFYIKNIEVSEEQYNNFYKIDEDERKIWSTLAGFAEKDFSINETDINEAANILREKYNNESEIKIIKANESFRRIGLDFDIDWGTIDYGQYIEDMHKLNKKIKELEKRPGK